jgi:hypothetical protein
LSPATPKRQGEIFNGLLTPTPAWDALRKEVALLNKNLNADAAAKLDAREAAAQPDESGL